MELKKWPETELEYWKTIESLGGFIWRMNHDAADGRFEMTSGIERNLMDAQKIMEQLVSGLFVPFGVVHPKDCPKMGYGQELPEPPPGFVWYWVWY